MSAEKLRKQARILMWLVTVPLALMALLALALVGSVVWSGGHFIDAILYWYLPMFLYMWAIWMIRHALKAISHGEMFSSVIPTLLFRVGLALFVGALYEEIGRAFVAELYWGEYRDPNTFEASGITLGVVGALLALIARLYERAVDLRDELEGFV